MTKKYLHVDIKRAAETTIVVAYDDRDWSWPADAEALTDFAVNCSRRQRNVFGDNDYEAGETKVFDDDGGFEAEDMSAPDDRAWRRFRSAMSDHPQTLKDLVCPDGVNVYLQMTVDGRRMRSLDALNLKSAEAMARSPDPGSELVADVCEQFLAVTGLVMGIIDIKAMMAKAFS
jgi:hypothetical protein